MAAIINPGDAQDATATRALHFDLEVLCCFVQKQIE